MIHAALFVLALGAIMLALAVDAGALVGALVAWLRRRWR